MIGEGKEPPVEEGYPVPARVHRIEEVVRRSRFIATLAPAPTVEVARRVIGAVEAEFPDARHRCWGYLVGPPGSTRQVGMSDAGEPHGTAGRPILQVLLHSGVGEVVAVVTRYFGGVKLGKGDLGRAYSGAVQSALETLPTRMRVTLVCVRVRVGFAEADELFRLLEQLEVRDRTEGYGTEVSVQARVPISSLDALNAGVAAATGGLGTVEVVD